MFKLFDVDNSGTVDIRELFHGLQQVRLLALVYSTVFFRQVPFACWQATSGTVRERVRFYFHLFDTDSSGLLDWLEISRMIELSCEKTNVSQEEVRSCCALCNGFA